MSTENTHMPCNGKCRLAVDNLAEIKKLVGYITGTLAPRIAELENTIQTLQHEVGQLNQANVKKRPSFVLDVELESSDEDDG